MFSRWTGIRNPYLGIEVYTIDKIYWLSGWKLRDQDSFKKLHDQWLKQDFWIIEGVGYWAEMERRITESDVVIFLDVPISLCRERAETRIRDEKLSLNPDITAGCVYGDIKARQLEVIDSFHNELRPKLVHLLSALSSKEVRIVGDFSELNIENEA